jgi:hypothetical protein
MSSDEHKIFLTPSRDEIGGLEKLATMDCDEIDRLMCDTMSNLICRGHLLMANCLHDAVLPIMLKREREQYRFVLASECPDDPGQIRGGFPEDLTGHPAVDPSELVWCPLTDGNDFVMMKRVRKQ